VGEAAFKVVQELIKPDKIPFAFDIIFLTPEENQQLTDLAEDIAQQMLGPDWKERQEQRRTALNEKIAKQ